MGYAPEKESLWTPAKSGTSTDWIDPDFDRSTPFILMYDKCDFGSEYSDDEDGIGVYRAEELPSNVMDLIVVLKAYTNGLFEMNILIERHTKQINKVSTQTNEERTNKQTCNQANKQTNK